ncbi:MAG: rod shape-determining protein MreD [Gammaproteobacteria bacterium]|nr:rod shape-determining protein MreD [Gammaproteobacteria bacterium]
MIGLNFLVIPLSLVLGLVLMMIPLPEWTEIYRPDWIALVLIYWSMAMPQRVGLWVAFISGLFVDVTLGTLLGQHSLALTIIVFINLNFHLRIRVMPLVHQSLYVFLLLLINQLTVVWIEGMMQREPPVMAYFGAPLVGMAIWPWVFIALRDIRRKAQLS